MKKAATLRWLKQRRIAVLKGGWSKERPISLKTGKAMEQSLKRLGVRFLSIDVKKNIESVLKKKKPKFSFIALHGTFGEDGQIQSLLDRLRIEYSGSGAIASSLAMNKATSKILFEQAGVPTAPWVQVVKPDFQKNSNQAMRQAKSLLKKSSVFVKPVDQGSAIGVSRVDRPSQLNSALKKCFRFTDRALVEKFVRGRELTVGILGDQALPVVEIIPKHSFYDFHSKYAKGGSRHLVPAPISKKATRQIQRLALKAFESLGCSGYGRVDFIMAPGGKMNALEVNTIPGMTETSLLPDAARSKNINFDDLILRLVAHSIKRKRCCW